jgi:hypothetical protein
MKYLLARDFTRAAERFSQKLTSTHHSRNRCALDCEITHRLAMRKTLKKKLERMI